MSNFRIPYSIPSLPKESGTSLLNAFSNVEISGSGTEVSALEVNVGKSICVDHSLAVSNGSAALRLAYMTLGLRPGAKVMLPGWGFHVAANIAFSMGAQVEFVDVSSETWCADYSSVDLTGYGENDFLVLIHTLGNCSDVDFLDSLPAECFIKPTDSAGFFPWGFGLRIKEGEFRRSSAEIRKHLLTRGIDSRPGFSSATKLPYFDPSMVVDNSTLRNSDQLSNEVILLPHYETLKATEIAEICELILENFVF